MNLPVSVTAEEFGRAIRHAREEKGWQQLDLAERLGVTRMTVSRLERGGSVNVQTAVRALSECGYGITVVPKFSRVTAENTWRGA